MSTVSVKLKPTPGFVVKSTTLKDAFYKSLSTPTLLDPAIPMGIAIPVGLKVFLNIAWDPNVPPPPEGSEDAIQNAMLGEGVDDLNPEGWYVPTVLSEGRQDKDKGMYPSFAFIFNLLDGMQPENSPSSSTQSSTPHSNHVPSLTPISSHSLSVRTSLYILHR